MKIVEVVIHKPTGDQVFVLGSKIQEPDGVDEKGEKKFKQTEVTVSEISAKMDNVVINLSNDRSFVFNGFPYILVTEK